MNEQNDHVHQAEHGRHAEGDGGEQAGHDPGMFRCRFWVALVLTVPLVVTSEMVMD